MKNLFLAFEIKGQWPASFPKARLIPDAYRHLTLAFIGPYDNSSVMNVVPTIPRFKDTISPSGRLDNLIFLPPGIERIAVLIPQFFDMPAVMNYQKEVSGDLLRKLGLQEKRSFLPHVSIARAPFDHKEWKEISWNIPFYVSSLSLYQTVASLRYDILWKQPYTPPFDEIDHTADLAYTIRGRNLSELFSHALLCLLTLCLLRTAVLLLK
jgi:2'-5' RNA ligase